MSDRLHPKTIALALLDQLAKGEETASSLGKTTGYNSRTVRKHLEMLESLGFVQCKKVKLGTKLIRIYSICTKGED